jgi:hypothetical protein
MPPSPTPLNNAQTVSVNVPYYSRNEQPNLLALHQEVGLYNGCVLYSVRTVYTYIQGVLLPVVRSPERLNFVREPNILLALRMELVAYHLSHS